MNLEEPGSRVDSFSTKLELVRERIRSTGREPETVRIVAVTKGFGPHAVMEALDAGLLDIGENYVQEMMSKADQVRIPACWHYLGVIQRKRVREMAQVVGCWETVSRLVEGESIADASPGASVMVQINTTGIPSRNGCEEIAVAGLVAGLRAMDLNVTGLMAIGPLGAPELTRYTFSKIVGLAEDLGLTELSIGMSADLEIAVEEGATMVRIGRALFGDRPR